MGFKLSELYSEHFANWISSGKLVTRDKISHLGIRALYDRYLTHDWVTKVWMVVSMPVNYDKNLTQLVRTEMFKRFPEIKTTVHFTMAPTEMNVRNNIFLKQFENVSKQYNAYKGLFESLTADQQLTGVYEVDPKTGKKIHYDKKRLDRIKEEYDSYMYLYKQVSEGAQLSNTSYFIQASGHDDKQLLLYRKALEKLLTGQDIYFVELHGNISEYLNNCCPATYQHASSKKFATMLCTEEDNVFFMPTKTRGLLGGKGVLMGLDSFTNLPFLLNFFDSGTAQIVMLLGKTGCGKTYAAFSIALGLAALGVHLSAIDIKGNEWTKLMKYIDCVLFDMGGMNSRFVNTLRLDDLECNSKEDAQEAFMSAVNGTVEVFKIMVNLQEREGNVSDLESILRQAIMKLYNKKDVSGTNPSTFSRTAGLWYSDVLDIISGLKSSASFNDSYRELCDLIINRCSPYFMAEGCYADSFRNEITLKEILDTPGVIYSFNKNSGETLSTLDSLRVFMVQFLDGKKQYMRRKKKLHTAAFYEELQRAKSFGSLASEISHKVTGSRSNNVIIFLLFNAINTFDDKEFFAIRSNITTKIVGKVENEDIKTLVDSYGCKPIEGYLNRITSDETGRFQHCFAIQYDTGMDVDRTIYRTVMPKEMSEHFNTRDRMEL